MMKLLVIAALFALAGCTADSTVPQTPRQGLLAADETLQTYTQAVGQATLSGAISQSQHDALMVQIKQARDDLNLVRNALADVAATPADADTVTTYLTIAQQILADIQAALPVEKAP